MAIPGFEACTQQRHVPARDLVYVRPVRGAVLGDTVPAREGLPSRGRGAECVCPAGLAGDDCDQISSGGCSVDTSCPPDQACISGTCLDPCLVKNPCAADALCTVAQHSPVCTCPPGQFGDPYVVCGLTVGCRDNSACPPTQACINNQCQDPCRCGRNAVCEVTQHRATCRCPPGYQGDPLRNCQVPINPCDSDPCGEGALCELDNGNPICVCPKVPEGKDCEPNPCGPNSGCRVVGGAPVCFCLPEFIGNPPSVACSPPSNPCSPSPCGPNTECNMVNGFHRCTCRPGYVGNPNTIRGCEPPVNPCVPSPCGQGALCDPNRKSFCYCRPGLIGDPYTGCRVPPPSCGPGVCGQNAECYVRGDKLQCRCLEGYRGDPKVQCEAQPDNPCEPSPCGPNAQCSVATGNYPVCACFPGFFGDADSFQGCKPECVVDTDCSDDLACISTKCVDPCPGACGINSLCEVNTHRPVCFCPAGFMGNPYIRCEEKSEPIPPKEEPGQSAVCSCIGDYIGDPKDRCRPQCVTNADCADDKACIDQKCRDPCPGLCGVNAECEVVNHNPICFCPKDLTGDPFRFCVEKPPPRARPRASRTRAGQLRVPPSADDKPICSCLPNFFGSPCRPECTINPDCPMTLACINYKCVDPCQGSCGINAKCSVVAHNPVCRCPDGLTGDPFSRCFEKDFQVLQIS
nr:fibropellin-1-like [Penaeus vannamei]